MSEKLIATIPEPFGFFDSTPYYPPKSLIVSPDSRRVAYAAEADGGGTMVVDGVAEPLRQNIFRDSCMFSPDSQRMAYHAEFGNRSAMVIDGKVGTFYDACGGLSFSPDSRRVAYGARRGESMFIVVDGQEWKAYDEVTASPLFSPDSRHVTYAVRSGEKDLILRDDAVITTHDFMTDTLVNSRWAAPRLCGGDWENILRRRNLDPR
jgi:hypothetical protein